MSQTRGKSELIDGIPADLFDLGVTDGTDGQVLSTDGAGALTFVDQTGGGGSKNYFNNASSELESGVGNWLSDNGSGAVDTDFVVTVTDTENIAGAQSLVIEKAASNTQDSFAKCLTTAIDLTDRGKTLYGSFSYDATATNYVSGDLIVQVYDVTNSSVLYSSASEGLEILKTKGRFNFTALLENTTASIELRIVCASTNALAYDVIFDEFKLGPASQVSTIYRNSTVIDLAGSGDFTAGKLRVSRVGTLVSVRMINELFFSSNSSPSSLAGVIPEWALPDVLIANIYTAFGTIIGRITVGDAGDFGLEFKNFSGTLIARTSISGFGGVTYNVEDNLSPTVTENELSLQTMKTEVVIASTQTVSSTSPTKVNFNTIIEDTHGAFNTSSNRYNVLKTGRTRVEVSLGISSFSAGERLRISVYKNGTLEKTARRTTDSATFEQTFHTTVSAVKGDYLEIYVESDSDTSYTISNVNSVSYAYFESVPDFTTLGVVNGGGIISGSNSNGSWIKFPDGTMKQWGEVETTQAISVARGSLFFRYGSTITFPEEFNSAPEVFVNYKSNSGSIDDREFWATGATPTTTTCPTCLWSPVTVGSATHVVSWNAVGRWKA